MCGFISIVDESIQLEANEFKKVNDLLHHRGPDSGNIFIEHEIALGSRRLRIHDLSENGDQPFTSTCGRYKIIFNGAIYNYRALRHDLETNGSHFITDTDTEVLIEGYKNEGVDFVKKLEGMFAYAIYDKHLKEITYFRDHVGIKPLYYYVNNKTFIASSEIKPILEYPSVKKEINKNVIPEFFAFQSIQLPDTFFKNIYVFPPASYLKIKIGNKHNLDFVSFWKIDPSSEVSSSPERLREILIKNLDNAWRNDRRTGIQLSGGIDSSLIAAWSSKILNLKPINSFSVIFNDDERIFYKPRSEKKYIDEVVDQFGINSNLYLFQPKEVKKALPRSIWYNEAPITGPSTSLYFLLAQKIKKHVSVVITGEGVDDIFNGYFDGWNYNDDLMSLFKFFVPDKLIHGLFEINDENNHLKKIQQLSESDEFKYMSNPQKTSYLTIKRSLHSLLSRHDRMFMANGIEGRPPFTANNIIDTRFSMKDKSIDHKGYGKYVFKKYAEKYFPKDFVYRKKIGFSSPYGDWLYDEKYWGSYWKFLDYEIISEFMDVKIVKSILDLPDTKKKWTGGNLNFLMSLMNFQLWYLMFFDNKKNELFDL